MTVNCSHPNDRQQTYGLSNSLTINGRWNSLERGYWWLSVLEMNDLLAFVIMIGKRWQFQFLFAWTWRSIQIRINFKFPIIAQFVNCDREYSNGRTTQCILIRLRPIVAKINAIEFRRRRRYFDGSIIHYFNSKFAFCANTLRNVAACLCL